MRALTIFIDEQWLAAVSEKDMSVPSHIIATDMTEELPMEVQYLGVTKTTYIYDENVLDEEKAVYHLRKILEARFEMSYDVQEAIVNYRISELPDDEEPEPEKAEDTEPARTASEIQKKSSKKRMRTAPDTSVKDDAEDEDEEPEIVTIGDEGGNAGGKHQKKTKDSDGAKSKKTDRKLGQNPIAFGNRHDEGSEEAPAFQRIKELKGSNSLIELCERLDRIAPKLQTEDFIDVLEDRAYLFSAEQDIGINARVSMFFDFMRDENLLPSEYGGCEIQLACGKSVGLPTAMAKQFIVQTEASMYCVDISSWIGNIDDPEFRDFLLFLYGQKDMYRYVFRIPYVEKKVLNQVADVIGDIFTVEVVTLPPLSQNLLEETAVAQLRNYGYEISEDALELFRKRIAQEKSDGRFYGMNTISKVVKEMVLKKLERSLMTTDDEGEDSETEAGDTSKNGTCEEPKLSEANVSATTSVLSEETSEKDIIKLPEITGSDIEGLVAKHHETTTPEHELEDMIGTEEVREQLKALIDDMVKTGKPRNVRFVGNPGTGRTVVARILGEMLKERGLLKKGDIIEHSMKDLMGSVPGETVPKTLSICRDALDSVLFIDEPYPVIKEVVPETDDEEDGFDDSEDDKDKPEYDFHKEALETLISEMQANEHMLVVFALTKEELEKVRKDTPDIDKFMADEIEFKDFSRKELGDIFLRMVRRHRFHIADDLKEEIMDYFDKLPEKVTKAGKFTNARYVRNLFDRTWSKTLLRAEIDHKEIREITGQDFRLAAAESADILNKKEPRKYPLGFRLQEED